MSIISGFKEGKGFEEEVYLNENGDGCKKFLEGMFYQGDQMFRPLKKRHVVDTVGEYHMNDVADPSHQNNVHDDEDEKKR